MSKAPKLRLPSFNPRGKVTVGTIIVALLTLAYQTFLAPQSSTGQKDGVKTEWRGQSERNGGSGLAPTTFSTTTGNYDYLLLVLSWSPTYCAEQQGDTRSNPQCDNGRPYAFVLHGLWPQHTRGWPESYPTKFRPWVDNDVIASMIDIMPSRPLIIHEYKKHGTSSGLEAGDYYKLARKMYDSIQVPAAYQGPSQQIVTNVGAVEQAFLKANPGLNANVISVGCARGGSTPRLQDVRICFDKSGSLAACGSNERQDKLCRSSRITLPPVR